MPSTGVAFKPIEYGETRTFPISFADDLATGEAIINVTWGCGAFRPYSDPDAQSYLGDDSVVGLVAYNQMTGFLVGNVYVIEAGASTTLGNFYKRWSTVVCIPSPVTPPSASALSFNLTSHSNLVLLP